MTQFIADIASYQKGLVPAELRPSVAALIVKCTEGATYVDPYYSAWLAEGRGTGLLLGAYHYVDGSSPQAQAENLKAHIVDEQLAVMLDSEDGGLQQQLEVADAMTALGLRVRIDYLSRSYWAAIGSPDLSAPFRSRGLTLVTASYPTSAAGSPAQLYPGDGASEWNEYGGVQPGIWQFTNAADEDGQRIDVSAYRGTLAELAALFGTTAPAAPPAPTPDPTVVELQTLLNEDGASPKLAVDGQKGPLTKRAFAAAMARVGTLEQGSDGVAVRLVQAMLNTWWSYRFAKLAVDGSFGPLTTGVVEAFQAARHVSDSVVDGHGDGRVGPATKAALAI